MSRFITAVYNPYALEQFRHHVPFGGHDVGYHDDKRTLPARKGHLPYVRLRREYKGLF